MYSARYGLETAAREAEERRRRDERDRAYNWHRMHGLLPWQRREDAGGTGGACFVLLLVLAGFNLLGMYLRGELERNPPTVVTFPKVSALALALQGDWECENHGRIMQITAGPHPSEDFDLIVIWRDPTTRRQTGQSRCRLTDSDKLEVLPSDDTITGFGKRATLQNQHRIVWDAGPACHKINS